MDISVCNEWEPFSALFYVFLKRKIKTRFHEIFFVLRFDTHSYGELVIFSREMYYCLEFFFF